MSIIRDITIESKTYWRSDEILIFIGARQAGKTTILKDIRSELEQDRQTCYWINLEDPEYLSLLNQNPKNIFKIFTFDLTDSCYLFIDEIQYLNDPTNFLKFLFDEYRGKIKLIVSGSSSFYLDRKFKDSLAGRKKIFQVNTLSFKEFLRFKGQNDLLIKEWSSLSLEDKSQLKNHYREFMIFGGYPKVVLAPGEEKIDLLQEIAYSYIKKDIFEADIKQDEVFYKLFKILANQIGSLVNAAELASTLDVSKTTIDNYLYVMQKSFHLALIRPFAKNIRKELTKMPKAYFLDLGLRNFFSNNFQSFEFRNDNGQILENACFRQLEENYQIDEIHFWRTINQKEVDFVINKNAYEVKINPKKFNLAKSKLFIESYPEINFSLISFELSEIKFDSYPILEVWQL